MIYFLTNFWGKNLKDFLTKCLTYIFERFLDRHFDRFLWLNLKAQICLRTQIRLVPHVDMCWNLANLPSPFTIYAFCVWPQRRQLLMNSTSVIAVCCLISKSMRSWIGVRKKAHNMAFKRSKRPIIKLSTPHLGGLLGHGSG